MDDESQRKRQAILELTRAKLVAERAAMEAAVKEAEEAEASGALDRAARALHEVSSSTTPASAVGPDT
jgi:ribosomal protein S20